MALGAVANGLAAPRSDHPRVSGLVVDVPAEGGYATVVALTDDTTSMYTSGGGGTIGAGQHEAAANATHALLRAAELQLDAFDQPEDPSLPPRGPVRFHLLAPAAGRTLDVPAEAFWGRAQSPVMPVIAATQQVITALREASPS